MIYLDMDGVLADFDAGARAKGVHVRWDEIDLKRHQMTAEQLVRDDQIRDVMATPGFFETLPPMADAQELWDFCAPYDPVILTARPKDQVHAERCQREKRAWVDRVFGPIPDSRFICTLSSLKQTFIGHTPAKAQILVDDRLSNCLAWGIAGGTAVLHKSAADSIMQIGAALDKASIPLPSRHGQMRTELRPV